MSEFPGFVGPSNRQASIVSDTERSLNLYTRIVDSGTPKAKGNLYRRPGLKLSSFVGSGPVRALFAQDNRMFAVSGTGFFEIDASRTATACGSVRASQIAATISSSGAQGHQLFITSGGLGYIFDLNDGSFTQITDDAFPTFCTQGLFFDSSFLALNGATGAFVVSDLYDGLSWDALNQGIESQFSDQVIAFQRSHDNLFLFGTRNTAVWANAGAGGAAGFVPIPGTIIEHGIAAPFSCVEVDNTPYWLGQDAQGAKMVWRADGYTPVRVSTHAVEFALASAQNVYGSVAWAFQEQGHTFYVLYVPGLDTTWVYDISTQLWSEWDHWDTRYGRSFPYVGVDHCYAFGKHFVGDRQSGAIYEQSMSLFEDALVVA